MSSRPAVEVEALTVRYRDVLAVDGASFTAGEGAITAVLGPNGAGKTSTVEVCEGFRPSTSGRVRVLGLDPRADHRALTRRMGVMLQEGGVYPSARVIDTVRHAAALAGRGARADELVDRVGLGPRRTSTWRRLSGGERQRLSLALALAAVPDVAFLDEPTAGVDVHGRDTIRGVVRDLSAAGCAVVLCTHDLDEVERLADHVVVLDHGSVVAEGSLAELRRGHDEIRFRSSPDLDLAAMAVAIGTYASRVGHDEYVIDAPPQPRLMALLGGWLADNGHALDDVRAGAQRMEDVFRRLTSTGTPAAGASAPGAGTAGGESDEVGPRGGPGRRRGRARRQGRRGG